MTCLHLGCVTSLVKACKAKLIKVDQEPQIQTYGEELFRSLILKAEQSTRKRMNFNFHASAEENPHRFLNVFVRGSYVTPHRHAQPPKPESFLVLEGWLAAMIFDDSGKITQRYLLGTGPRPASLPEWARNADAIRGMDLAPGVWHTVAAVSQHAVCFEVKPGPWDPTNDKEFAPWAPMEGTAECSKYLAGLIESGADVGARVAARRDNAQLVAELRADFGRVTPDLASEVEPATVYSAHVRVSEADL